MRKNSKKVVQIWSSFFISLFISDRNIEQRLNEYKGKEYNRNGAMRIN